MLVLETIAKIRRAYFVQQKTIKAICRELRVSRKVVRKVLRSEPTEFRYERGEQPAPRIGLWREALDEMLASNEAKPRRERLKKRPWFTPNPSIRPCCADYADPMRDPRLNHNTPADLYKPEATNPGRWITKTRADDVSCKLAGIKVSILSFLDPTVTSAPSNDQKSKSRTAPLSPGWRQSRWRVGRLGPFAAKRSERTPAHNAGSDSSRSWVLGLGTCDNSLTVGV